MQIANHDNDQVVNDILNTIVSQGSMQPIRLNEILKKKGHSIPEVKKAVALLVNANFLRYRSLACHGKLIECYIQNNWLKEQ